jgi:hypothetical protein
MHDLFFFSLFFRDYVDSGSVYITPDSGGEYGVPYETYFFKCQAKQRISHGIP